MSRPGSRENPFRLSPGAALQAAAAHPGARVEVIGEIVRVEALGMVVLLRPERHRPPPPPAPPPVPFERARPRESRAQRVPARAHGPPDDDPRPRPAPQLVLTLPLEGEPTLHLVADSFEDEQRLIAWAWRSPAVRQLGPRLLDLLDGLDRRAA